MDFTRQSTLVTREGLNHELHVVGAGAIGSFTLLNLGKMGYLGSIYVWDNDRIEPHNIPNQFYPMHYEGMHKSAAINGMMMDFCDKPVEPIIEQMARLPATAGAVLLAVDSMDARIQIYNSIDNCRWLYDGRMGAEVMRIYTIDLHNKVERHAYESTLYPSTEADQLPCTARSVVYNVSVIAGLLANQIKRSMSGQKYAWEIIFDLQTLTLLKQES